MRQTVSEPEPGLVLVEAGAGASTRFTAEPKGSTCRVQIETVLEAGGLMGFITRLVAPRLLVPVYCHELERLEQYAQALRLDEHARVEEAAD